jgi:Uma2 family endonuclease
MLEKCEHCHAWGTPYCWVIDPERQTAWEYHRGDEPNPLNSSKDVLTAGEIQARLQEIFSAIAD